MTGDVRVVWVGAGERRREPSSGRRAALAELLTELLAPAGSAPCVAHDEHGRPYCPEALELSISATARGGWAAAAATPRRPIGIDVEAIDSVPEWRGIGETLFAPEVVGRLARCAPATRPELFAREWAHMEACAKAAGTGIRRWREDRDAPYEVTDIPAPGGYVAALAVGEGETTTTSRSAR